MIYLDESGELGFGPKASKYFVMAALIPRDPVKIKTCIKRVRQQKLPKKYKQIPELKSNNSSQTIKRRVLECLARTDSDIVYAVLRKEQVFDYLKEDKAVLYNYISGLLLRKVIEAYKLSGSIDLVIDKSLYNSQRDNFDNYLTKKALKMGVTLNQPEHPDSLQEPCIQAVDFVAGAIHSKYRDSIDAHYKIIEPRISIIIDLYNGKGKDCVVNPSLLRPICLRAASSFSGRTYNTT